MINSSCGFCIRSLRNFSSIMMNCSFGLFAA
nr:MAG TPA: hypothetical protein [Bacteriophage sp.]